MGSLESITRPRNTAGLNRLKFTRAVISGRHASVPVERRFDRLLLTILRMVVFAFRVRLPDLKHGVDERYTVTVEDTTPQMNPLALGLRIRNRPDGMIVGEAKVEEWTESLGRTGNHHFHRDASNGVASGPRTTISKR